ncbi:MAG: hypothetical protein C0501_18955 [Isosphaera sp.]|nr:hypothetical protein [Isosphaera sp.]
MTRSSAFALLSLAGGLFLAAGGPVRAADEKTPWPAPVKGFVAPKPGEHPRLFFRKADVPEMRKRAETPEGKEIVTRLRFLLNGGDGEAMPTVFNESGKAYEGKTKEPPVGKTYTLWHGAGYGMLYQLTGDRKYADLGRQCVEKALAGQRDRDDRYSWVKPGGALRAGPSLGAVAMAYDLCHDGWDEDFRKKVAGEIQGYNQGQYMSLGEMARGARHNPGSNHWGCQIGGAGLAVLAVEGDPGTDAKLLAGHREAVERNIVRQVTEGFGDHGYFHEHPGPGQIASDTAFVPLLQAMRVAGGKDFVTPRPNAEWVSLKWALWLLPTDKGAFYPNPHPNGGYGTEYFQRAGLSKGGQHAQGFGAVDEKHRPAMLWVYRNFVEPTEVKEYDELLKAGERSYDALVYPHRAVLALANWPIGVEPKSPEGLLPKAVGDERMGYYVFRNRWQDADDTIVGVLLGARNDGPGTVHVWGLKERVKFGQMRKGKADHFAALPDGSGTLTAADTFLAVDYSGASGAEALVILGGAGVGKPAAKSGGPAKVTDLTVGGKPFSVLTLQKTGDAPVPKVDGDKIVVGGQTVTFDGRKLVLAKTADARK